MKKKEKVSKRKQATKKTNGTNQGQEQQHQNKIYIEYKELQNRIWEKDDKQKEYNKTIDNIGHLIYALDVKYNEIISTEKE